MNKKPVLEGLLFLCGSEGISFNELTTILEVDPLELKKIISEYESDLNDDSRGLTLMTISNVYKLSTKREHFEYYDKLVKSPKANRLSNAALEVLAIVAYNAPITRSKVEHIRGVNSDGLIKKLMINDLIKEVGRGNEIGKPILHDVTDTFMDYFGLASLEELPELTKYNPEILDSEEIELFNKKIKLVSEDDLSGENTKTNC